jgi:hypothetical protein
MELSVVTVSGTIRSMRVKRSISEWYRTLPNAFTFPISQNKELRCEVYPSRNHVEPCRQRQIIGSFSFGCAARRIIR